MLKIKLARFGKKKQPHYRLVVNEAKSKRDGAYVAVVGHYAPTQEPKLLSIDVAAFDSWVKKGAQPTETVASLAERYKSGNPFPAKAAKPSKKVLAKSAAAKKAEAQPKAQDEVKPVAAAEAEEAKPAAESAPAEPAVAAPEVVEAPKS